MKRELQENEIKNAADQISAGLPASDIPESYRQAIDEALNAGLTPDEIAEIPIMELRASIRLKLNDSSSENAA